MKILLVFFLSATLNACISQNARMNNRSEDTLLSPDVKSLLAENDGILDTREHENVRCKRIRIVGSHRVTRLCYTREEDEAMRKRTRAELQLMTLPRGLDLPEAGIQ